MKRLVLTAAALGAAAAPAANTPPSYPSRYRLGPIAWPALQGRYAVGVRSFELARADGTPLGIVAWYPAARSDGPRAPYFTEAEKAVTAPALARTFRWPVTMLDNFAALSTRAQPDAPVARGRFPLVVFSHGFLMYPRQNSALMERLAAAGYVVLSVPHPRDSADLPSSHGPLATALGPVAPEPDPKTIEAFWAAPDRAAQRKLLPALWRSTRMRDMERRLTTWREDLRITADAAIGPHRASALGPIASAIRQGRFAYAGMSFGGSSSVSACVREPRCAAAINLDGIEFDSTLYDRDAGKPVLLIQSDWTIHPNGGPAGRTFTSYDLAYERWATAGRHRDIFRYRLSNITHMGMTDLILAPRDPQRDVLLGTIDGARATEAINATSLAFLDRYLTGKRVSPAAMASRYPELIRHSAGD
ncbi:hypothetical protein ASE00_05455 [Sphingomonas sp. Root710]|uniref:alpha/beta hydrolase n=1 Tax=Sphingomonas sp. Root710 TaxID=1736594 RepID=UPI0006F8C82D|nr:hypothetical protein [Sphingomonas sp. Root710]KRB86179.1 hypothetical protein ASE00_05455 [Sphingomonas sp. Root710]